jgi:BRCT domain type II-containing protein
VVVGDNPGSKALDAKRLGITTLDEDAFLRLLASGGVSAPSAERPAPRGAPRGGRR